MSFGENLKSIRLKAKKNQTEFSKMLGISRTYLSDLENNRKSPSLETVTKLSEKLNISLLYLLEGKQTLEDYHTLEGQGEIELGTFEKLIDHHHLNKLIEYTKMYAPNEYTKEQNFALFYMFLYFSEANRNNIDISEVETILSRILSCLYDLTLNPILLDVEESYFKINSRFLDAVNDLTLFFENNIKEKLNTELSNYKMKDSKNKPNKLE